MKTIPDAMKALCTDDEIKEATAIGKKRIRLEYLKGSKEKGAWAAQFDAAYDLRMWNLIEPKLPGYTYDGGYPTFTLAGLRERGII